jgi:hypothetical protein
MVEKETDEIGRTGRLRKYNEDGVKSGKVEGESGISGEVAEYG